MKNAYPMRASIIRAQDGDGPTRIDVYDDIGAGGWFDEGLTAKAFSAQLAKVTGPLDVHINSCGGDVGDGLAIGSTIRGYKDFKRTVVDGFAASIASVIFQAGDERIVEPGSMVMLHDAMTLCVGSAADMRETADVLDKHSDNIAGIYAARAGGTASQWRDTMSSKDTWYTAEEAVSAGLADRVGDANAQLPAGFDLAAFAAMPGRIAARLRAMPQAAAPRAAGAPAATDTGGGDGTQGTAGGATSIAGDAGTAVTAGGGQPGGTPEQAHSADAKAFRSWLKKEIRAVVKKEVRAGVKARLEARTDDSGDAAEGHADISGLDLEQIRAALRGATQ